MVIYADAKQISDMLHFYYDIRILFFKARDSVVYDYKWGIQVAANAEPLSRDHFVHSKWLSIDVMVPAIAAKTTRPISI